MVKASLLSKFPIFNELSHEQLERIVEAGKEVTFNKGEIIVKEGESGQTMYLILEGEVEVSKTLTLRVSKSDFESREKTITRFSSKDHLFFGEMALLGDSTRTATVAALTDCSLYSIKKDDFEALGEEYPVLGYKLVRNISRILCDYLKKANSDILKLTTALSIALTK